MLIISGNINGVEYKEKFVAIDDAMKILGLEVLKRDSIHFKSSKVMFDKLSGQNKNFNSVNVPLKVALNDKEGNAIELIYARNRSKLPNNEGFKYMPYSSAETDYPITGEELLLNRTDAIELAIFYAAHPWCKTSPFYQGGQHFWELHIPEEEAAKKIAIIERLSVMQTKLFQMKESALKTAAAGIRMTINGQTKVIQGVDDKSRAEILHALLEMLNEDPEQFEKNFDSAANKMYGLIERAIDNNLIVIVGSASEKRWQWKEDGEDIAFIGNQDPKNVIRSWFANNVTTGVSKLNQVVQANTLNKVTNTEAFEKSMEAILSQNEDKPLEELSPSELYQRALPYLEERDQKAYLIQDGQIVGGKALLKLSEPGNMEIEITEKLGDVNTLTYKLIMKFLKT